MSKLRRLLPAVVALLLVACGSGASSSPPGSPSASPGTSPEPSERPATGEIDHPTGATDVVLRYDELPGFVMIDFVAGQTPYFTLYGDGTIVFQQLSETFPEADGEGITRPQPLRTAKLDESQIQELLAFAIGPGGLGVAGADYGSDMIADASTAVFTLNAGGTQKEVKVYALDIEDEANPDAEIREAFRALGTRLRDFDQGGTIETVAYAPTGWRAVLIEREADPQIRAKPWPWADLTPADFSADVNAAGALAFPHAALTAEQLAATGIEDATGGFQGLVVDGPDGKVYTVVVRPLLPDETE